MAGIWESIFGPGANSPRRNATRQDLDDSARQLRCHANTITTDLATLRRQIQQDKIANQAQMETCLTAFTSMAEDNLSHRRASENRRNGEQQQSAIHRQNMERMIDTLVQKADEDRQALREARAEQERVREEQDRQREEDRKEARLHRQQMTQIIDMLANSAIDGRRVSDEMQEEKRIQREHNERMIDAMVQNTKQMRQEQQRSDDRFYALLDRVLPSENLDANRTNQINSMNSNLMVR